MKKRLKINGVIIFLAILTIVLFPELFFRSGAENPFNEALEVFGIALIFLGLLFRISARGYKSEHSRQGETLVSGGPYSLVRNPMYLGIFLVGFGIVLILFKWWLAGLFLIIFMLRYVLLMFREEKKLRSIFREEYDDYCRKVPQRVFPSLNALLVREFHEYLPVKIKWLKRELGSALAVLLCVMLLESWDDIRTEGWVLYFKESIGILVIIGLFAGFVFYLSRRNGQNERV